MATYTEEENICNVTLEDPKMFNRHMYAAEGCWWFSYHAGKYSAKFRTHPDWMSVSLLQHPWEHSQKACLAYLLPVHRQQMQKCSCLEGAPCSCTQDPPFLYICRDGHVLPLGQLNCLISRFGTCGIRVCGWGMLLGSTCRHIIEVV